MIQQKDDGSYKIVSGSDFYEAVALLEEKEQMVEEIHEAMEEEYEYKTLQAEIESLKSSITTWMTKNDHKAAQTENGTWRLIRQTRVTWDVDKLAKLIPKSLFLKITDRVVNKDKIDDLARGGALDREVIAPALVESSNKPYLKFFKQGEKEADREADEVEKALNGS